MLSNTTQTIIFDAAGFILESTDTLFRADDLGDAPLYTYFPILESISPILFSLKDINHIPRVEIENKLLSGVYDFYLKTIKKRGKEVVELTIEDRTVEYDGRRKEQQERQERIIKKQRNF